MHNSSHPLTAAHAHSSSRHSLLIHFYSLSTRTYPHQRRASRNQLLRHGQNHKHQANLSSLSTDSKASSLITTSSIGVTTHTRSTAVVVEDDSLTNNNGSPAGSTVSDNSSIMFAQSSNRGGPPIIANATAGLPPI